MKNKSLIFILIIFFTLSYDKLKSQHYVGFRSGVNLPNVFFSDFVVNTNFPRGVIATPHAGLIYRFLVRERIGVQAEILYSQKGWQQITLDNSNIFTHQLDYIEVPLLFHLNIIKQPRFKLFFNAGPYAALAFNYKYTISNPNASGEENRFSYSLKEDNIGDFGVHLGGGLSYAFGKIILQLEGNFKLGFANLLPYNELNANNPAVSNHQVPALSLAVLFKFD